MVSASAWTVLPLIANSDDEQRQRWMQRAIETLEPVLGRCKCVADGFGVWRTVGGKIHEDPLLVPQWYTDDATLGGQDCLDALKRLSTEILVDAGQAAFSLLLGYSEIGQPPAYYYVEKPLAGLPRRRSKQVHHVVNRLARSLSASVTGFDHCLWFMTPSKTPSEASEFLRFLTRYSGATAIRRAGHDDYLVVSFADTPGAFSDSAHDLVDYLRMHDIRELFIAGEGIRIEDSGTDSQNINLGR